MFDAKKMLALLGFLVVCAVLASAVQAADVRTVTRFTPGGAISGVPAYDYYHAPAGTRILGVTVRDVRYCQIRYEVLGGTTLRSEFHSPPGSILGVPWGGGSITYDVVLEPQP